MDETQAVRTSRGENIADFSCLGTGMLSTGARLNEGYMAPISQRAFAILFSYSFFLFFLYEIAIRYKSQPVIIGRSRVPHSDVEYQGTWQGTGWMTDGA